MKKITFILFALIAGTTFAQTQVPSSAEIIEAITITEVNGLNFGRVDNTAGIVGITTGGVISGKTQIGGSAAAGSFKLSGEAEEVYIIDVPTEIILEGPGTDLDVTGITHTADGTIAESGQETVTIGGTLTVADGQTAGAYSGTISVTVSYN